MALIVLIVSVVRILISNDDSIFSPGIQALATFASTFGEVRIVAPEAEQSSMGHAITSSRPLTYRATRIAHFNAYRVNGTPADCVSLGMYHWSKVDVVLSGINLGHNLGNGIWHSGTLAAAKQAALFGVRGIALSAAPIDTFEEYEALRPFALKVLSTLFESPAESKLINVNFPEHPRGIRWTKQSVRHYDGRVVPAEDPLGRQHFWFVGSPIESVEPGTDRWAISQDYVSVTPLRLDLTDVKSLAQAETLQPFEDVDATLSP
jgi:5'-nucleotidase